MKTKDNDHKKAIKLLIDFPLLSTNFLLNSGFHKFSSRIGEVENEHGTITERGWVKFAKANGSKAKCRTYRCTDIQKAKEIYLKY